MDAWLLSIEQSDMRDRLLITGFPKEVLEDLDLIWNMVNIGFELCSNELMFYTS